MQEVIQSSLPLICPLPHLACRRAPASPLAVFPSAIGQCVSYRARRLLQSSRLGLSRIHEEAQNVAPRKKNLTGSDQA